MVVKMPKIFALRETLMEVQSFLDSSEVEMNIKSSHNHLIRGSCSLLPEEEQSRALDLRISSNSEEADMSRCVSDSILPPFAKYMGNEVMAPLKPTEVRQEPTEEAIEVYEEPIDVKEEHIIEVTAVKEENDEEREDIVPNKDTSFKLCRFKEQEDVQERKKGRKILFSV